MANGFGNFEIFIQHLDYHTQYFDYNVYNYFVYADNLAILLKGSNSL